MKIENANANASLAIGQFGQDPAARRSAQKSGGTSGPDSVQLSGDLRLAKAAVQAVGLAADIRPDAVAHARALLESGELGTDLDRLADRMVNALTYSYDDDAS